MASSHGGCQDRPVRWGMPWTCALMTIVAAVAPVAPLSAQIGLASTPRSVQLIAVKHGSVSLTLPAGEAAMLRVLDLGTTASITVSAYLAGGPAGDSLPLHQVVAPRHLAGARLHAPPLRLDSTVMPESAPGPGARTLHLVVTTQ